MIADSPARKSGVLVALVSAAAFAASGPFMKPLLEEGWSPTAAVAVRAGGAALVLLVPAVLALRGRFRVLINQWKLIVAYGLIAVAGTQVFYFAAIERLPVGIALLIEYLAPVLLVLLAWGRTRIPPAALTISGTVLSIVGLILVVDPTGVGGLDAIGVLFGLGAAVCLACFFLLSAMPVTDLPAVALVCAGLLVGSISLVAVGSIGLLPLTFSLDTVRLLGMDDVPWFVPMTIVVLVSTALAYLAGLVAAKRLGSRVASFVGLSEVMFAVLLSWLLLGEVPTIMQATGGALIIAGVIAIKLDRPTDVSLPSKVNRLVLAEKS